MNRQQRRAAAKTAPGPKGKAAPPALLVEAVDHYRHGRLDQAEALCLRLAKRGQADVALWRILGGIAIARRDAKAALGHLEKAVAAAPADPLAHLDLGVALRLGGRPEEAAQALRTAIALAPGNALAHNNLGVVLRTLGRLAEAEAACRQALTLEPGFTQAWSDLGTILADLGRLDDAIASHEKALALQPAFWEARGNLAVALAAAGRLEEAETALRQVVAARPQDPLAHNNLGGVLEELGRHAEAEAACRQATTLVPSYPEAWNNLGNALTSQGRLDEAAQAFARALGARPTYAEAQANLGRTLSAQGRTGEAEAACRRAIALKPDFAEAHNNLAMALLLSGDLAEGWREYEWRWRVRTGAPERRDFPGPRWEGQPLAGRTLLLHPEQGYGDQLQFCRYASLAAREGARVVLMASRPLLRLFSSLEGVARLIASDEAPPPFDFHQSLMSLPGLFGTTLETIPAAPAYLAADTAQAAAWGTRLRGLPGLKVGLVWAGEPRAFQHRAHAVDRRRSLDPATFLPLLAVPGTSMVSLQMGGAAGRARSLPEALRPLDVMEDVGDFADTAAIIANLDLVITVDTSVAHLAGALGKPVWVLSRYDGCWRWLLGRDDSPWYPSLRLFRQQAPGDWEGAVAAAALLLAERAAAR